MDFLEFEVFESHMELQTGAAEVAMDRIRNVERVNLVVCKSVELVGRRCYKERAVDFLLTRPVKKLLRK
jgi:hypothetical protein